MTVERAVHFNLLGAIGWWLNGRILRRRVLPGNQLRAFNLLTPLVALESWLRPPWGLSLMLVCRRTPTPSTVEADLETGAVSTSDQKAGLPAS